MRFVCCSYATCASCKRSRCMLHHVYCKCSNHTHMCRRIGRAINPFVSHSPRTRRAHRPSSLHYTSACVALSNELHQISASTVCFRVPTLSPTCLPPEGLGCVDCLGGVPFTCRIVTQNCNVRSGN